MQATSFPVLLAFVTVFGMSLGLFDTADNSLMVYIFGPVKSRPFTQSVHAFVGVGFVLGSVLVQVKYHPAVHSFLTAYESTLACTVYIQLGEIL